jgi:hypothetical protein
MHGLSGFSVAVSIIATPATEPKRKDGERKESILHSLSYEMLGDDNLSIFNLIFIQVWLF